MSAVLPKAVDGIYVTLSKDLLIERGQGIASQGYRHFTWVFGECKGDNDWFFHWRLSNKPTREFVWVYIVIGNKVRWRARFFDYKPGGWIKFSDAGEIYAKQWMLLYDFERMPRPYEVKKGFQGFRYKI